MPITDDYIRLPLDAITIDRSRRQRTDLDIESIVDSIRRHGVLQPIIVRRDGTLVAGERRYTASLLLGLPDVPCRYLDTLDEAEAHICELEENIRRKDIPWQDEVRAIGRLHADYTTRDVSWNAERTAGALALPASKVSDALRVLRNFSEQVRAMPSLTAAANHIARKEERQRQEIAHHISSTPLVSLKVQPQAVVVVPATPLPTPNVAPPSPEPPPDILLADFAEWAPSYDGPPFNLIHCDFPYGIDAFGGKQGTGAEYTATGQRIAKLPDSTLRELYYDDAPGTDLRLIRVLCANLERLAAPSCHLVFWFHMTRYRAVLSAFDKWASTSDNGFTFQPMPLVWLKSDNVSVLADPERRPRHVYETAFLASRGDRRIVRSVVDAYACQTDKTYHTHTKPEPMLRHFFRMLVDETTSLFDPTCGSGSALRAAESLGAKRILGLELNPEHYDKATRALKLFRAKRKLEGA